MRPMPFLLALALAAPLAAQEMAAKPAAKAETTVGQGIDSTYMWVEGEFMGAADAMPEDKFGFAPKEGEFKGVKTYAQQIKHVASVNFMIGAMILGEKPPAELGANEAGPDSLKTKAEIVTYAKESFAYARKAIQSITAANGTAPLKNPFGEGSMTRLGMATLLAFHGMDHYGQMVVYLRMNGIIPPASRPQPKK